MEKIKIQSRFNNVTLHCNVYEVENPNAVVQVIHGMMEHQLRYQELAEFLNRAGYTVISNTIDTSSMALRYACWKN